MLTWNSGTGTAYWEIGARTSRELPRSFLTFDRSFTGRHFSAPEIPHDLVRSRRLRDLLILHTIGRGSDDHDPKRENRDILLVLKVSIDRHEGVDQTGCSLQQGAVLRSIPAQTLHGRNRMANQRVDQVVRKVHVKQYAHVSTGSRARAQGLRWPVRVERTETA